MVMLGAVVGATKLMDLKAVQNMMSEISPQKAKLVRLNVVLFKWRRQRELNILPGEGSMDIKIIKTKEFMISCWMKANSAGKIFRSHVYC